MRSGGASKARRATMPRAASCHAFATLASQHISTYAPSPLGGGGGGGTSRVIPPPHVPMSAAAGGPAGIPSGMRAAQLARYRQKRMVRVQAVTMGFKKIRYACRKTLADNRPRVKGRFAKVHGPNGVNAKNATDGLAVGEEDGDDMPSNPKDGSGGSIAMGAPMAVSAAMAADGPQRSALKTAPNNCSPKVGNQSQSVWWHEENDQNDSGNVDDNVEGDDGCVDVYEHPGDSLKRCFSEPALMKLGSVGSLGPFEFVDCEW